jgi:hypothetical protein
MTDPPIVQTETPAETPAEGAPAEGAPAPK